MRPALESEARAELLRLLDARSHIPRVSLQLGEMLMEEGEAADRVYVLMEGSLTVTKAVNGQSAILARIDQPGTVVGEMVTMGGGTRTASVSADTESTLFGLDAATFHALLDDEPRLAKALASAAARRAEEGELAEILVERLGLEDPEKVAAACSGVTWRTLEAGSPLFEAGGPSDEVYFVVRGRLQSTRATAGDEDVLIGEYAKGDIVGDLGVLSSRPRISTVTAVRRTIVAGLSADDFIRATESQPKLLVDLALAAATRATEAASKTSPATVIAVASPGRRDESFIDGIANELRRVGRVEVLSASRVDSLLETPGVAHSPPGEVGDIRVSRLVNEMELQTDHLILDMGEGDDVWARRCLDLADRVLLLTPLSPNDSQVRALDSTLKSCPSGVSRTLVVVHSSNQEPSGSATRFGALSWDDLLNVVEGSDADRARVARVVSGRANVLVIGGGGARGFAHIGAYRAVLELGIPIDVVAGTSIGGVIGTLIADGNTPEELVKIATESFADVLDYTFPSVSLIKGERITKAAREHFGLRHIEDLRRTFVGVSTDLTTSRPHFHVSGDLVTAIRATCAIPGVMPPVPMGEALLVDGGVLNNLPMDVARNLAPAGRVLAFDVAPTRGPRAYDDYGLSVSGWTAMRSRGRRRSPYPRITSVLLRSMITASMRERDRQVGSGLSDFYVNLDISGVSMLDFSDPGGIAERGYAAAMPHLEAWLDLAEEATGQPGV